MRYALLGICCVIAGCGHSADGPAGGMAPRLTRVAEYRETLYTMRVVADLDRGLVEAFGPRFGAKKGRWAQVTVKLSDADMRKLQLLVASSGLRSFRPRTEWFGECRLPDTGASLVLTWPDKEVAFSIPPRELRRGLPSSAVAAYRQMDRVDACLADIVHRTVPRVATEQVPLESRRICEFRAELSRVRAASLPTRRHGW